MFASDDEKRKKERKNLSILTSVLASLSAIVESLPCVRGQPLVTVWGQILIDRLCDLLTHSNTDIRAVAAGTLATFSLVCSGGGRIEGDAYRSHARHISLSSTASLDQHTQDTRDYTDSAQDGSRTQDTEKIPQSLPTAAVAAAAAASGKDVKGDDEEGAWLIQACLGRLSHTLSSSFEKKGTVVMLFSSSSFSSFYSSTSPSSPSSISSSLSSPFSFFISSSSSFFYSSSRPPLPSFTPPPVLLFLLLLLLPSLFSFFLSSSLTSNDM
jgi:hypothetical protein